MSVRLTYSSLSLHEYHEHSSRYTRLRSRQGPMYGACGSDYYYRERVSGTADLLAYLSLASKHGGSRFKVPISRNS